MLLHMSQKARDSRWRWAYASSFRVSGSGNGWKDQRPRDREDQGGKLSFQSAKPYNQTVNQVKGKINYESGKILSNQVSKTEKRAFQNTVRISTCMVGPETYALSF